MQQGCRTTTSTQSITCTATACSPHYEGGCNDSEYQQDSTQTYCNVEGDTTICGYSVICCDPVTTASSVNNEVGGLPVMQNYNNKYEGTTTSSSSSSNNDSSWWGNDYNTDETRYTNYSPTWNGQPLPSQELRSTSTSTNNSTTATQAGAGAGLGFAFVVIIIAAIYAWRREQRRADCPGGLDVNALEVEGIKFGIDSDDDDSSEDEEDGDGSTGIVSKSSSLRRGGGVGRDPSVNVIEEHVLDRMARDPSVKLGSGGGSGGSSSRGSGSRSSCKSKRSSISRGNRDPSVRGSINNGGSPRSVRSSNKRRGSRDPSINGSSSRRGSINNDSPRSVRSSNTKKNRQHPAPAPAPPRPPPFITKNAPHLPHHDLHRKLSGLSRSHGSESGGSLKQRNEWVKKTIYDSGSDDDGGGFDDDTDSQLQWAA